MFMLARWKRWRQWKRRQRGFFHYFDGTGDRWGDPFFIWRAIASHPKVNFSDITGAMDAGQEPETTDALNALCEVFGVQRWNPETQAGLSDWEIMNLLGDFSDYLDALKKNINSGPTLSPPTEPESSTLQEPQSEPEN
jgi:hypothetical protein